MKLKIKTPAQIKPNRKPAAQAQEPGFMAYRRQVLNENSSFVVREAYRALRTNIRFALRGEGCKKFCITSSAPGEGKSITILNLAITIAENGQKVILIDGDMRRPALARLLMEKAAPGLSNVLAGEVTAKEAVRKEVYPNLDILLSGNIPPNPSELLGSEQMQKLVETLSEQYDYILIDAPPAAVVTDVCVIGNMLDGVLVLARQGRVRKDELKHTMNVLELADSKVLGCIFNGVPTDVKTPNYGYYE